MDVSDRNLLPQLTPQAKIFSFLSLLEEIFAFAGFISVLGRTASAGIPFLISYAMGSLC